MQFDFPPKLCLHINISTLLQNLRSSCHNVMLNNILDISVSSHVLFNAISSVLQGLEFNSTALHISKS